jgi:hypothetical protein
VEENLTSWAWAAGLFEGEGCISDDELRLKMTDEDVVRRFAAAVALGTIYAPYASRQPNRRPAWVWVSGRRRDVEFILARFLPYLGARRAARAREALAVLAARDQKLHGRGQAKSDAHRAALSAATRRAWAEGRMVRRRAS